MRKSSGLKDLLMWTFLIPRNLLVGLISLYQKTLSPDHGWPRVLFPGGYCKFTPSCSQYAKDSVKKHGLIIGFIMGFWRVLRCNPWSKGGHDPVK